MTAVVLPGPVLNGIITYRTRGWTGRDAVWVARWSVFKPMRHRRKTKDDSTKPSDLALARQIASGSQSALTTLYERYITSVYQIALRLLRSEADADDVAQDVFVGLPHSLRTYRGSGSLEAWLRKVTLNTALMKLRKSKQRSEVGLGMDGGVLLKTRTFDPTLQLTLEHGIKQLPEILRIVYVLKEVEGYSHAEIAELLGIEAETSRVRLYRARRRMRDLV